ncbi:hypothetical protein N865_18380 [Intrasporangium oryzae NRRL B-24470]|uniref:Uncharacterized protein n=1 Tax=Intrasporangium oryzae NRRL B-24470 TaxID=1386089 RepID=W9G247_9MICO|nr:hypothetical protein [Intrasporangium oryzae]EWT00045.1 hypothetical protein N865_18380 [Intrasporangium oryzae NRRL B-24470]
MNEPTPLSDLVADDLLLDALGRRVDCGHDPLASVLGALAVHADSPLGGGTPRRGGSRRRIFTTFAVLAVGATGAGVAAAVTLPHLGAGHEAPEIFRGRPGKPAVTATQTAPPFVGVVEARKVGAGTWTVVTDPDGSVQVVPGAGADSLTGGAAAGATSVAPGPVPSSSGSAASTAAPKGQADKKGHPAPSDAPAADGTQSQAPEQDGSGAAPQSLVGPTKTAGPSAPGSTGGGSTPHGQAAQSLQSTSGQGQNSGQAQHSVTGQGVGEPAAAIPSQAASRAAQGAEDADSSVEQPPSLPVPPVRVPFLPTASAPLPSMFLPYLPFPTGR